jgi:hypothetical protein
MIFFCAGYETKSNPTISNMLQDSNLPSNTRPQTSYPSGPSWENPPRREIVGGYVIDNPTGVAWGSRLLNEPLNPDVENDSMNAFSIIMMTIQREYRTRFIMIGPECYGQYMVVTQSAAFSGWKGVDPELIPKFKEGEREAVARDLLEAEGKLTQSFTLLDAFEHPDS